MITKNILSRQPINKSRPNRTLSPEYLRTRQRQDQLRNYWSDAIGKRQPTEKWMVSTLGYIAHIFWCARQNYRESELLKLSQSEYLTLVVTIKNNLARGDDNFGYIEEKWGGYSAKPNILSIRHWLEEHGCFLMEGDSGKECYQTRKVPAMHCVDLESLGILAETIHDILTGEFGYKVRTLLNGGLNPLTGGSAEVEGKWISTHINTVRTMFNQMFEHLNDETVDIEHKIEWGRQINDGFMLGLDGYEPEEKQLPYHDIPSKFQWMRRIEKFLKKGVIEVWSHIVFGLREIAIGEEYPMETEICFCCG